MKKNGKKWLRKVKAVAGIDVARMTPAADKSYAAWAAAKKAKEEEAVRNEAITNAPRYNGWAVDEFIAETGLGFRLGNVVKYIARAGKKEGTTVLADLNKARAYLERHIDRLNKGLK